MKKLFKLKSIITVLLVCVFSFTIISCGDNKENKEKEEAYTPIELKSNGESISDYKIVISEDATPCEQYAATELQKYINKATSCNLVIVNDSVAKSGNEIVLGQTNRQICENIDYASLGDEGYIIKNFNNDLLIASNEKRGILYGVYSYLEMLGYRFYATNVEKIPETFFVAKDVNITTVPQASYREIMYGDAWDCDLAVKLKINSSFLRSSLTNEAKYGGSSGFAHGGRGLVHTFTYASGDGGLLPERLLASHPEYFAMSEDGSARKATQPCLTNEGALAEVTKNAISWLDQEPTATMISISQNDIQGGGYCHCTKCEQSYQTYGYSGTLLNFVNRVADAIGEKYPNVLVDTLSYQWTKDMPKGGVVPRDNVIIRVCLAFCYSHTNENECDKLKKDNDLLRQWMSISKHVQVWTYVGNYVQYMAVLPNFTTMYENRKILSDDRVQGLYYEGHGGTSAEFGELRVYLLSKLAWNPDMTKAEYYYHMDDFLKGYYGDGWKNIREYIDYLENYAQTNADKDHERTVGDRDMYDYLSIDYDFKTKTYDLSLINHCKRLWDKAEEMADEEEIERIEKSRISFRWYELSGTFENRYKYGSTSERERLVEENELLYNTIQKYNFGDLRIRYDSNYYIKQNITDFRFAPHTWKYYQG